MQDEIGYDVPDGAAVPVRILGINEAGQESGNAGMFPGPSIPWLQDTLAEHVWNGKWQVEWRDVVVLDDQNRRLAVYNLTTHNLADAANYTALRNLLLASAGCSTAATAPPPGSR